LSRAGLALVILVCTLLAASTWRTFGHTWDEPEHLAAGLELLDQGKYEYDTEHPPIARALIALGPYLAGAHSFGTPPPDGVQEGIDILYDGGRYDRTLTLARLGTLPFLPLLLLSMWLWARWVARSEAEALLGVVLLGSVPPVLGHAALATLDVPGTATTLLALYMLQRALVSGAARDCILFGFAAGVAVATKLSAVPFIGLGMLVLVLVRAVTDSAGDHFAHEQRSRVTRLGRLALTVLAACVPILLAYGPRSFHFTTLPPRFDWALDYLLSGDIAAHGAIRELAGHLWLPEGFWDFAEGIVALKAHNDTGHLSFLLGQYQAGGWWYFYLVDLAVKTPLPLLVCGPIGLALLARDGWRERNAWRIAPIVLFLTVLGFASAFSRINIGIRHVLILYPFMALGAAYFLATAWRALRRTPHAGPLARLGTVMLAGLVGWQLSTLWTAHPDYFPYFNETVRHPEHVLIDSDLDWGQDLRRLERRLAELKVPSVSLAYSGTADLAKEKLPPFILLPPRQPVTGWVAITALTREHEPARFAWLNAYEPVERVGKTIDLYFIPAAASQSAP
jgi:Dolichyl-phosphate-mannose-protein mannosyltransferase